MRRDFREVKPVPMQAKERGEPTRNSWEKVAPMLSHGRVITVNAVMIRTTESMTSVSSANANGGTRAQDGAMTIGVKHRNNIVRGKAEKVKTMSGATKHRGAIKAHRTRPCGMAKLCVGPQNLKVGKEPTRGPHNKRLMTKDISWSRGESQRDDGRKDHRC